MEQTFLTEKEKARIARDKRVCDRFNELVLLHPEISRARLMQVVADENGISQQRVYQILTDEGAYKKGGEE